jgi:hypothetical protein
MIHGIRSISILIGIQEKLILIPMDDIEWIQDFSEELNADIAAIVRELN